MSYYENIYDINFLSGDSYENKVGCSSVIVLTPGIPDWTSWRSSAMEAREAEHLYDNQAQLEQEVKIHVLSGKKNCHIAQAYELILLLVCETAYRNSDQKSLQKLCRILITSESESVRLRAVKLLRAFSSLALLYGTESPLSKCFKHTRSYLNEIDHASGNSPYEIRVEDPVRHDWLAKEIDVNDRAKVESFYRTTPSYIAELTAANHQVETLHNYSVIIEVLSVLGVTKILDFGSGIGTFVAMASKQGFRTTYSDLESVTLRYAMKKLQDLEVPTEFMTLDYNNHAVPQNLDCVVCTEVLEHIFDPKDLVATLNDALRPGGVLVVSESFDYTKEFCSHLPQHEGMGGEKFLRYLESVGFRRVHLKQTLHPSIHVKLMH